MNNGEAIQIASEMLFNVLKSREETEKIINEVCQKTGINPVTDKDKPADLSFSNAIVDLGGPYKMIGRALNVKISLAKMRA